MAHLKKGSGGHLFRGPGRHLVKTCGSGGTSTYIQAYDCADDSPLNIWYNVDDVPDTGMVYGNGENCIYFPDPPDTPTGEIRTDLDDAHDDCEECTTSNTTGCNPCWGKAPAADAPPATVVLSFDYTDTNGRACHFNFTLTRDGGSCKWTGPLGEQAGCDGAEDPGFEGELMTLEKTGDCWVVTLPGVEIFLPHNPPTVEKCVGCTAYGHYAGTAQSTGAIVGDPPGILSTFSNVWIKP